jgi:predicted Zn-dependent peptidase
VAYAETNPEVVIRYHSVADGNVNEPALLVLGELLSGRTGRLYKSLVLDQQIATGVSAGQSGMKWEGYFELNGVAKPSIPPEQVEQSLYQEIEKLQKEKVSEHELQKIKNQFAAYNFRRLDSPFNLMMQILVSEVNRGWRSLNEDPRKIAAVTTEDIQRVANIYFKTENRAVALYYTKKSDEDPLMAGLDEQQKTQIRQFKMAISKMSLEEAKAIQGRIESRAASARPEDKAFIQALQKLLQDKLQKDGGK